MIAILSPAKSLELTKDYLKVDTTIPVFLKEANTVSKEIKKWSTKKIQNIQGISEKLAALNYNRNQSWGTIENENNLRPAVYMFDGEVYHGLNAYELSAKEILYAQQHLKIASGLYGILKPLDIIEPYRLEMGTHTTIGKNKNLYAFWSEKVTKELKAELSTHKNPYLINLASNEYAKVINIKKLEKQVIQIDFLEEENGKYKNISFFSKKARGLMARYIIENQIDTPEDIKSFNVENYQFNEPKSTIDYFVFTRKSQKAK